ncbi:MAG: hypothetical protein GY757_46170, partial [bacterium]|nr:hypothetical protein [bacterium]
MGQSDERVAGTAMKKIVIAVTLLLIINVLLYIGTLNHDFLKDDFRLIVENHRIKDFDTFISTIDSKFFAFPDFPYLHYWRPLALFSFYVDYRMWGLNPRGYHFTNIIINAVNSVLIFLVFFFMSEKILFSFITAVFFSVHPSHVEAVSWVSGRTDLIAALFIFAAILFFILFRRNSLEPVKPAGDKKSSAATTHLFYMISILFFSLALLSKENAVLFPLVAALLYPITNHINKTRLAAIQEGSLTAGSGRGGTGPAVGGYKQYIYLLPLFLIDIAYVLFHNSISGVQGALKDFSFANLPAIIKTAGVYTKIIMAPFFPSPYFSMQQFDLHSLEYYLYFLAALLILALVIVKRKEYRFSLYTLLFFIFLLPVLDPEIVPSSPKIVIRFAYIPALFAGVFFLDTFRLLQAGSIKKIKHVFSALLVIIAGIWIVESISYQVYFKDTGNYYNRLAMDFPDDASLLVPLALQKAGAGDLAHSLRLLNHALEYNEKDRWMDVSVQAGLLKANILIINGRPEEGKSIAEGILKETDKEEIKYFACLVLAKY